VIAWWLGWIIPGASIIGPLIIAQWGAWISGYAQHHIEQAVKFNLVVTALTVPAALLTFSTAGRVVVWIGVLAWLAFTAMGTFRAGSGERFRYPLVPGGSK